MTMYNNQINTYPLGTAGQRAIGQPPLWSHLPSLGTKLCQTETIYPTLYHLGPACQWPSVWAPWQYTYNNRDVPMYNVTINKYGSPCPNSIVQPILACTGHAREHLLSFILFWFRSDHCHACLIIGFHGRRLQIPSHYSAKLRACMSVTVGVGFVADFIHIHTRAQRFFSHTTDNRHYRCHLGPQFHVEDDIRGA